ncbi:sensor histidine kinase [Amaricoccus macauensis]|uniref:sensor histidine kinase n=1 Tax=Amaricoccus macauensis TaxID=57001 RepID=UPI003C7C8850
MAKDSGGGQREALAELIHDAPCGIVLTDPDARLLYVNDTLNRWLGFPAGVTESSRRLPDLMTLPGRLFYETHVSPMMRLQGFAREIACVLELENGGHLPVLVSGIARLDADGVPFRFDFTIFDARERHVYEEELRAARRQADELAAIVRSSPNAILRVDHAGMILSWNAAAERLLGQSADAVMGKSIEETLLFEGRPDWFARAIAEIRAGREEVFETPANRGQHFEITVVQIDEIERPTAQRCYSVVLRDITQRKNAEYRLKVAMHEMRHRIRNTLTVVSGIARQTLPVQLQRPFVARLNALSRASDALTAEDEKGADLRDLLAFTAEEAGGPERFRISGPSVMLSPRHVTSLSMALHEMATNALKYGALSEPQGYVQVDYARQDRETGPVRLVWQERDGPPVAPPTRQGFGSKMINTVLKFNLSAEVAFDYRPEGVRCEMVFHPGEAED